MHTHCPRLPAGTSRALKPRTHDRRGVSPKVKALVIDFAAALLILVVLLTMSIPKRLASPAHSASLAIPGAAQSSNP